MPRKDQAKPAQLSEAEQRSNAIQKNSERIAKGLKVLGYASELSAALADNLSRLQNGQGTVQTDNDECRLDLPLALTKKTGTATLILRKPTFLMPFTMFIDRLGEQQSEDWVRSDSAITMCFPWRGASHQDCVDLQTAGGSLIRFSRDNISGVLAFETRSR